MTGTNALARRLSFAVVALMAVQALTGLLYRSAYNDVAWIEITWLGNDLFTLLVAVPLLAGSLLRAQESRRAELLWCSMLGYSVYNYAYYLLGATMNAFFPLYVVLFVGSVLGLVTALASLDVAGVAESFDDRTPRRRVAGYMFFTGGGLAIAWLGQWAALVFAGRAPSIGEGAFRLVASLDLTMVVPYFLIGGALLWTARPWGYVLGTIMNVKGALYTGLLTVNSVLAWRADVAGAGAQIPVWGLWCLAGCLATFALLRHVESPAFVERQLKASST